jgi:glutamate 5-kinase
MERSDFTEKIKKAKRIVIKIGSARVSGEAFKINQFLFSLISDIELLREEKKEIILVTSGAVAQGERILNLHTGKNLDTKTISDRQALASIGQSHLMNLYENAFSKINVPISQVLFGMNDIQNDSCAENLKNTFEKLFSWSVLPIVNENDSASIEELKFGDNDILSSLVSLLVEADLLIILTGVDGFLIEDKIVPFLNTIEDSELLHAKGPEGPGTGGMNTKLTAAKILIEQNIPTAIINGKIKFCLREFFTQNKIGTLICNFGDKKKLKIEEIKKIYRL